MKKTKIWDRCQTELRSIYAKKSGYNDPTWYFVKYLLSQNIINGDVLAEVGFGDGQSLRFYSKVFQECHGLDISPKNIELTRDEFRKQGLSNVSFEVFDLLKDNHIQERYDIIVASHGLEHFDDKELNKVIANIKRMLKQKGFLIGATPCHFPFNYRFCPNCGCKFEIDGHKQIFDETNIVENLGGISTLWLSEILILNIQCEMNPS